MCTRPTEPGDRTLVAYWGIDKPAPFAALLRELQSLAETYFEDAFDAYTIDQMHATLLGLESVAVGERDLVVSQHALDQCEPEAPPQPVAPLDEVWRVHRQLLIERPMTLLFGGNESPNRYRAAFQVGRTSVIVVGWPLAVDGSGFDDALWQYRAQIGERTGYVHKYAREKDNDFYVVLGRFKPRPKDMIVKKLLKAGRELVEQREVLVELPVSATSLVEYENRRLPLDSRILFPRRRNVTHEQ